MVFKLLTIQNVLNLLTSGLVIFLVYAIKKMPTFISNLSVEKYKIQWNRDLEKYKIDNSQLSIKKVEEYQKMTEVFGRMMDAEFVKKMTTNNKIKDDYNKELVQLCTRMFLFASDDTIQRYAQMRKNSEFSGKQILELYVELLIEARKDLGNKNTKVTIDDYMYMILSDWDVYKNQLK